MSTELRSSTRNQLHVPWSSTSFGECSLSVAGTTAWNSFPDHVTNAPSLNTFKCLDSGHHRPFDILAKLSKYASRLKKQSSAKEEEEEVVEEKLDDNETDKVNQDLKRPYNISLYDNSRKSTPLELENMHQNEDEDVDNIQHNENQ